MGRLRAGGPHGILRWAAEDAEWRPALRRRPGVPDDREQIEQATGEGVRVESILLGLWSHGDLVAVRGRLRVRKGSVLDDSRMYWVHRLRDGKVVWSASSPDLGALLEAAGLDRGLTREAYAVMHGGLRPA